MTNQSEQAKGLTKEQRAKIWADKEGYEFASPYYSYLAGWNEHELLAGQSQPGIKQWVSEWIDVKDRLPEVNELVLVLCQLTTIPRVAMYFEGLDQWRGDYGQIPDVTHWQPQLQPPNSTTTPKSDMVSKAEIINLLEQDAKSYKQYGDHIELRTVQDCISKIKNL